MADNDHIAKIADLLTRDDHALGRQLGHVRLREKMGGQSAFWGWGPPPRKKADVDADAERQATEAQGISDAVPRGR